MVRKSITLKKAKKLEANKSFNFVNPFGFLRLGLPLAGGSK